MKYTVSCILLFITLHANAHGFFNNPGWCANGTSSSIGSIDISPQQLFTNIKYGVLCAIPPAQATLYPQGSNSRAVIEFISPVIYDPDRDHGIMDSKEAYQAAMAYSYCACASLNASTSIDPDEINPTIITPDANSPAHHASFQFGDDGLQFSCNVCIK
jgi:hypothetical protein